MNLPWGPWVPSLHLCPCSGHFWSPGGWSTGQGPTSSCRDGRADTARAACRSDLRSEGATVDTAPALYGFLVSPHAVLKTTAVIRIPCVGAAHTHPQGIVRPPDCSQENEVMKNLNQNSHSPVSFPHLPVHISVLRENVKVKEENVSQI